jgi:hypothetical protein
MLDNNLCIFPRSAEMDEENISIKKLETTNTDLSRLVKKHEIRIVLMKVSMHMRDWKYCAVNGSSVHIIPALSQVNIVSKAHTNTLLYVEHRLHYKTTHTHTRARIQAFSVSLYIDIK